MLVGAKKEKVERETCGAVPGSVNHELVGVALA